MEYEELKQLNRDILETAALLVAGIASDQPKENLQDLLHQHIYALEKLAKKLEL